MSYHDGSHTGFAIFLNKQNLAFALPLITLCTVYAFFNYVPLPIALTIIGTITVLYKITSSIKSRAADKKEEKIASLDESLLKELAADEVGEREKRLQKTAKKQKKANDKILQRIKDNKKAAKNAGNKVVDDEDDDIEDTSTFASGGRGGKSKKR
eukprot:CAMPEP_0198249866 /NCGR_PEP_ID=MMETSP1447-20131203/1247_1 /TAXON_ID=420782 /ORGANISM="Chaetoceros dichaeta, Strain CCMP1751" /LENGTH=154 /DNA_ID=CAMNT_0043934593 /DNA_START=45 /DNA_END=509 /DNA_ORIENTATION=-